MPRAHRVLTHPLYDQPTSDGYIAILSVKKEETETCLNGLLTPEQYDDVISKRAQGIIATPTTLEPSAEGLCDSNIPDDDHDE